MSLFVYIQITLIFRTLTFSLPRLDQIVHTDLCRMVQNRFSRDLNQVRDFKTLCNPLMGNNPRGTLVFQASGVQRAWSKPKWAMLPNCMQFHALVSRPLKIQPPLITLATYSVWVITEALIIQCCGRRTKSSSIRLRNWGLNWGESSYLPPCKQIHLVQVLLRVTIAIKSLINRQGHTIHRFKSPPNRLKSPYNRNRVSQKWVPLLKQTINL